MCVRAVNIRLSVSEVRMVARATCTPTAANQGKRVKTRRFEISKLSRVSKDKCIYYSEREPSPNRRCERKSKEKNYVRVCEGMFLTLNWFIMVVFITLLLHV